MIWDSLPQIVKDLEAIKKLCGPTVTAVDRLLKETVENTVAIEAIMLCATHQKRIVDGESTSVSPIHAAHEEDHAADM
jgi:hypothetical protein